MYVAEAAVVLEIQGVNGPPESEAKIVNPASPLPTSLPDQLTRKSGQVELAGSVETWLTGAVLSIVLIQV